MRLPPSNNYTSFLFKIVSFQLFSFSKKEHFYPKHKYFNESLKMRKYKERH